MREEIIITVSVRGSLAHAIAQCEMRNVPFGVWFQIDSRGLLERMPAYTYIQLPHTKKIEIWVMVSSGSDQFNCKIHAATATWSLKPKQKNTKCKDLSGLA